MPWLTVNQTLLCWLRAVPAPVLALEVQRGGMPGQPGAKRGESLMNEFLGQTLQASPPALRSLI